MFNKKYKDKIKLLESEVKFLRALPEFNVVDLMRDSLGLTKLDFSNIDDEGMPSHYLKGLSEEGRKNYVADLESIYANEKFQAVVSYVINLIGNHAIQKADEDKMRNGRIGIIGIRTLMNEFTKAHSEFLESKKKPEEFDPLETL